MSYESDKLFWCSRAAIFISMHEFIVESCNASSSSFVIVVSGVGADAEAVVHRYVSLSRSWEVL